MEIPQMNKVFITKFIITPYIFYENLSLTVANANHLVQMTTSLIENIKNCDTLMSQSLDGSNVNSSNSKMNNSQDSTPRTITPNPYNGKCIVKFLLFYILFKCKFTLIYCICRRTP